MMRSITLACVLSSFVGVLAGCGGAGSDSNPAPAPSPSGTREVSASQEAAKGLVSEANASVNRLLQAQTAKGVPATTQATGPAAGGTITGSVDCSLIGTSGSGSISYSLVYTTAGQPVSYHFAYQQCTWTAGGVTVSLDGTMDWSWTRWVSAADYSVQHAYDLRYTYSGTYNGSGTVRSSSSCEFTTATGLVCTYQVDGTRIDSDVSVTASGHLTTINHAVVRIDGTAASGEITVVFDHWVYDDTLGRATSGTVTATDSRGNLAVITATGSGYSVHVVYNGAAYDYLVTSP